jgi:hypothetical protein
MMTYPGIGRAHFAPCPNEHLAGPRLWTRHLDHLEDLNPTVLVESDCLHQPVTFPSARGG